MSTIEKIVDLVKEELVEYVDEKQDTLKKNHHSSIEGELEASRQEGTGDEEIQDEIERITDEYNKEIDQKRENLLRILDKVGGAVVEYVGKNPKVMTSLCTLILALPDKKGATKILVSAAKEAEGLGLDGLMDREDAKEYLSQYAGYAKKAKALARLWGAGNKGEEFVKSFKNPLEKFFS